MELHVTASGLRLLIAIWEAEDDGHSFNEYDYGVMIECVKRELARLTPTNTDGE